jgi:hypothetical protein
VKDFMGENRVTGCDFVPVASRDDPSLKKRREKPFVENPPPLWMLKMSVTLQFDGERSERKLVDECNVCGYRGWAFYGDNNTRRRLIVPIESEQVVPDVFQIEGMPMCFCTERFMTLITRKEFSSILMLPWGFTETAESKKLRCDGD